LKIIIHLPGIRKNNGIMGFKINLIRKTKWNLIRFGIHHLVEPFSGLLLNLVYLSRVSKWVAMNRGIDYNDFYSSRWDYAKRYHLYDYIFKEKKLDGPINYLEFGVSGGHSFRWWLKKNQDPGSRFTGFDTFEGLPEEWGGFQAGAMSTGSMIPATDDPRASFEKGLFQDTLPGFLSKMGREGRIVLMMDADLYTSTLYVLTSMAPFLKPGDIVFFDQFNVPRHEFLAFTDFTNSYYRKMKLLGAANNYYFCAFEVE
jgi:O-methyltransferase